MLTGAPSSCGTNGSNHDLWIFWAKQHRLGGCECWLVRYEVCAWSCICLTSRAHVQTQEKETTHPWLRPASYPGEEDGLCSANARVCWLVHESEQFALLGFSNATILGCWWPQARPSIASTAMLNLRWNTSTHSTRTACFGCMAHIRDDLGADTKRLIIHSPIAMKCKWCQTIVSLSR